MIVKVTRGGDTKGLMRYLVGPGRSNEHTDPHLVAGAPGMMTWYSTDTLAAGDAATIGAQLDSHQLVHGVEVTVPVTEFDEATEQHVPTGERRDAHVWHCSLSLAPDHDPITDETWGAIASDFVDKMGFSDADGKSPCQWAAVHHGTSKNGGDHIHLAVNLVRADGTKASTWLDYRRASEAAAELETTYGLEVVDGRHMGVSARAETYRELTHAEGAGVGETGTTRLARIVRASAAASASEGEFVRRCRREGLWVRPRFKAGCHDEVTGYKVAVRPEHGQPAAWRSAGQLGKDLALPRLRAGWTNDDGTTSADAAAEWQAAWRGQPIVDVSAEPVVLDDDTVKKAWSDIAHLNERLASVDPANTAVWSKVAGEASGTLAAWSVRLEQTPGPLASASDVLSRSAQTHHRAIAGTSVHVSGFRSAARVAAVLGAGMDSKTAQALILRQLIVTLRAIARAREATDRGRVWSRQADTIAAHLRTVHAGLPKLPPTTDLTGARIQPAAGLDSPLPPTIGAERPGRPAARPGERESFGR